MNQLMITLGILIAYLVNLAFSSSEMWRAMFAVGAVPAALMVAAALWFLPESPQWLIANGQAEQARKGIASVADEATADTLVARAQQRIAEEREQRERNAASSGGTARRLLTPDLRPALVVGLTLAAVQQFGGINTIIYYAPTIIQQTGLNASNSIFYSVFIGLINLVMTLVAIRLVDRAKPPRHGARLARPHGGLDLHAGAGVRGRHELGADAAVHGRLHRGLRRRPRPRLLDAARRDLPAVGAGGGIERGHGGQLDLQLRRQPRLPARGLRPRPGRDLLDLRRDLRGRVLLRRPLPARDQGPRPGTDRGGAERPLRTRPGTA